ncbi:MAG: CcdB family protein [Spirochaetales bacterium]
MSLQFDICTNLNPNTRGLYPYLLILQHDVVAALATRVVAPLTRATCTVLPIGRLHPTVALAGDTYLVVMHELASVPMTVLGPVQASLKSRRDEMVAALDLLFVGF